MVTALKINDTTMTPDELIELIRARRNDSTLEEGVEQKIMQVKYIRHIIRNNIYYCRSKLSTYNVNGIDFLLLGNNTVPMCISK
jgi:hypothetical protein